MELNILKILEKRKILEGQIVDIKEVDTLMEEVGFDGLGLDFDIENGAMTFYKDNIVVEIVYEIISKKGYFGEVKIKSVDLID